jgi:hypothetical protein
MPILYQILCQLKHSDRIRLFDSNTMFCSNQYLGLHYFKKNHIPQIAFARKVGQIKRLATIITCELNSLTKNPQWQGSGMVQYLAF